MPSYNQSRFVDQAVRSVIEQDYPDKEILFVDGGSTDDTMAIVSRYRDRLAYCVSRPDKGQSDALHSGFERATGHMLTWLNTDDLLLPGALRRLVRILKDSPDCEWVLGNTVWIDADGIVLRCWRGEDYSKVIGPRLGNLTCGGPSSFFSRDLYRRVGGLNVGLHYMMDTELWWRFVMSGATFRRLKHYTWALRLHEGAKVSGNMFARKDDPKQRQVAEARSREADHVSRLTQTYRFNAPKALTKSLVLARRLISPTFIRGQLDDRSWRGRRIEALMESLCQKVP